MTVNYLCQEVYIFAKTYYKLVNSIVSSVVIKIYSVNFQLLFNWRFWIT